MIYKKNMSIPLPNQCWECYQPPIYYGLCAVVLKGSEVLNLDKFNSWRLVQLINPLVSVFVLFLFYRILWHLEVPFQKRILLLSFFAVLPIDMLTCSMIGNDYLLVLFSALTFYYFSRLYNQIEQQDSISWLHYFLLCFCAVCGALTKQHGLLLIIFPASVLFLLFRNSSLKLRVVYSSVFILTTICSLSSEIQKFRVAGKFLVSNQDFYNYTDGQYPGDISRVEFFSFRYLDLIQNPYLSQKTSASFNTEIFARIFFDYEWRFLSPQANGANLIGQVAYVFGAFWVLYFTFLFVVRVGELNRDSFHWPSLKSFFVISSVVLILYALVPFVQTVRFPYFSSMKATFLLPGVIIFLTLVGRYLMKKSSEWLDYSLILVNLSFGFYFALSIYNILPLSLNQLSGPLFPIP
jgi:hypothetical protein